MYISNILTGDFKTFWFKLINIKHQKISGVIKIFSGLSHERKRVNKDEVQLSNIIGIRIEN